jgi:AhpD family alkylhydroperoxidase
MPRSIWPLALAATLAVAGSPAAADDALDAAKADMAATLGPDSVQIGVFPDAFAASTWAQTRAWLIDNTATIPPKYRALIGLAVSSQIPCEYCIYADTADARVFGATDEEIKEAIMFAGLTRLGSTLVNGNMVDKTKFKAEIDAGAAAMREALKAKAAASN